MRHSGHYGAFGRKRSYLDDLYRLTPVLVLASVIVAATFYSRHNHWDRTTSVFYAVQVIMGELYGVPVEESGGSQVFTLALFLWGNLITFGAIGSVFSRLVYDTIKEERKRVRYEAVRDFNYDGLINYKDYFIYYYNNLLFEIGWELHKTKYITFSLCLFWIAIGCAYGMLVENMSFSISLYFSIGMISCSGLPAPLCVGKSASQCSLRPDLAIFMAFFIIIGVPLFTFTLGQFSGLIIQKAVHYTEQRVLTRPLKEGEFQTAISLCQRIGSNTNNDAPDSDTPISFQHDSAAIGEGALNPSSSIISNKISLAEFLVLELIRLKRVDAEDIQEICELFHELDYNARGFLEINDLMPHSETLGKSSNPLTQSESQLKHSARESDPLLSSAFKGGLASPLDSVFIPSNNNSDSFKLFNRVVMHQRLLRMKAASTGNSKNKPNDTFSKVGSLGQSSSRWTNLANRVIRKNHIEAESHPTLNP